MSEVEGIDWKWLNEEKLYKVYRDGKIYNNTKNKYINWLIHKTKQIYVACVYIKCKSKTISVHILVYNAFNGELSRSNIVGFKDKNKLNPVLDNLVLLNRNDKDNKTRKIHKTSNEEGEKEYIDWKWLNEEKYYKIYKTGKVYSIMGEKYLIPLDKGELGLFITLPIKKARKTYKLSTLIWKLFCGSKIERTHGIYYKDGNYKNIHIDNLVKNPQNEPIKIDYDMDEWAPAFGFEDRYIVSKQGEVKSLITGEIMKHSKLNNKKSYKCLNLIDNNGKRKNVRIHRLVYSSFHKIDINAIKDKVVDHINRNSLDNRLENLRLISYSDNTKNSNKTKPKIYNISPLADDFRPIVNYKDFDFTNYLINSYGQIKNINLNKGGKIHADCIANTGYKMVQLKDKKTNKYISIGNHILVALAFLPNPNNFDTVHHKDSNRANNHISNLEWTTRQQNTIYAIGKAVNQYTLDGVFIKRFKTIKEAANSMSKKTSIDISEVCRGNNKTAYGYKWQFAN
jgi:hypothetical protein